MARIRKKHTQKVIEYVPKWLFIAPFRAEVVKTKKDFFYNEKKKTVRQRAVAVKNFRDIF
jgi:hypothetical protein